MLKTGKSPGAKDSSKQGNDGHPVAGSSLCVEGPWTRTCKRPSKPEYQAPKNNSFVPMLNRHFYILPFKRFEVKLFNDPQAQGARWNGRHEYAIHMEALKPKHLLNAIPGNGFSLG